MTTWAEVEDRSWDSLNTWADPLGISAAITSGLVTWAGSRVQADWARDGFGSRVSWGTLSGHSWASLNTGETTVNVDTATPAFIANGAVSHIDNAPVTPGLPAGITPDVGQLLLLTAVIRNSGVGTPDTPAGWTLLVNNANQRLFGRFYVTGDVAPTVTFTGGVAGATCSARMVAFSGLSMDLDVAAATQLNGAAQDILFPALTPVHDKCVILVGGWRADDWTGAATLPGFSELFDSFTVQGDDQGLMLDAQIQTTAAAVAAGTVLITGGTPQISRAFTVALRPAQVTTVTEIRNWGNPLGLPAGFVFDDLSTGPVSVTQSLDDGMPSEVTDPNARGVSELSAGLANPTSSGESSARFYSPHNSGSPVYGLDRDIAPVTADVTAVTGAGQVPVRVFTGQMGDIPVQGQMASLTALSATRQKLRALVQPPPIDGFRRGLTATWPVSHALHACDVRPSPPPRAGAIFWAPMHGSMVPLVPADFLSSFPGSPSMVSRVPTDGFFTAKRATFVEGPYVSAADCHCTAAERLSISWAVVPMLGAKYDLPTTYLMYQFAAPGEPLLAAEQNVGHISMMIRGDETTSLNTTPGGSASISKYAGFQFQVVPGFPARSGDISCGVNTDRKVYVSVSDGTTTAVLAGPQLPVDGLWHTVEAAWDISGNKLWVALDGVADSTRPSPALSTALLYASREVYDGLTFPSFTSSLPVAEVQVISGDAASPDVGGWVFNDAFTPGAVLRPSVHTDLEFLTVTEPQEAFAFIQEFAQAELAWTGTDQKDVFYYLPLPYWVETAQQTAKETLSTAVNLSDDVKPIQDLTKIFNQVAVSFTETQHRPQTAYVYEASPGENLPLLPGMNVLRLTFNKPIIEINVPDSTWVADSDALIEFFYRATTSSYIAAKPDAQGVGAYASPSQLQVTLVTWDAGSATLAVNNLTGVPLYLITDANFPAVAIGGESVISNTGSVTWQDDVSIAKRGPRLLKVELPQIQTSTFATFVAAELVGRLARPRLYVSATAVADPRRRCGDLVVLDDSATTGVAGLFRLSGVATAIDGPNITQQLAMQQAWLTGTWDSGLWDEIIWG